MIVTIGVGSPIQPVIDSMPPGTTFRLGAGVHRMQQISPRPGDTFEGETRDGQRLTSLSGAKVLGGWRFDGRCFYVDGQTQRVEFDPSMDVCRPDSPMCTRPEDLFIDDVLQKRVEQYLDVRPGTWFFDYDQRRIYVGANPFGRCVETSVTPSLWVYPFLHPQGISDVTVQDLIIEKFASPTTHPAIGLGDSSRGGSGWVMQRCELRFNHGCAVWNDAESTTRQCFIHHNGGFGCCGAGWGIVVEGNEIAWNNTCGYNPYWGAGGSKWVWTTGMIVRGNYVHHNDGPGIWFDINNEGALIEYNVCEWNAMDGIFYELSYRAIIRRNLCRFNGQAHDFPGWTTGAGIHVCDSPDVEVYENLLEGNWQGITGLEDHRNFDAGVGYGPATLRNLRVHDNTVVHGVVPDGGGYNGVIDSQGNGAYATGAGNRWERNAYQGPARQRFHWRGRGYTWAEWQGIPQDAGGSMNAPSTLAAPTPDELGFPPQRSMPSTERPSRLGPMR